MTETITVTITENSNKLGQHLYKTLSNYFIIEPDTTYSDVACAIAGCLAALDKKHGDGTAEQMLRVVEGALQVAKKIERANAWDQISDRKQ